MANNPWDNPVSAWGDTSPPSSDDLGQPVDSGPPLGWSDFGDNAPRDHLGWETPTDQGMGQPEGNQPGYKPLTEDDYNNQPQLDYKPTQTDDLGINTMGYADENLPVDPRVRKAVEENNRVENISNSGKSIWDRVKDTGAAIKDIGTGIVAPAVDAFKGGKDVANDVLQGNWSDVPGDVGSFYKNLGQDYLSDVDQVTNVGKRTLGVTSGAAAAARNGDWQELLPWELAKQVPYAVFGQDTLGIADPNKVRRSEVLSEDPAAALMSSGAEEWHPDIAGHHLSDIPVVGNFAEGMADSLGTAVRGLNGLNFFGKSETNGTPTTDVNALEQDLANGMSVAEAKAKYQGSPGTRAISDFANPSNWVDVPGMGEIFKGLHAETMGLKGGLDEALKAPITTPSGPIDALKQSFQQGGILGFAQGRARNAPREGLAYFDPEKPVTKEFANALGDAVAQYAYGGAATKDELRASQLFDSIQEHAAQSADRNTLLMDVKHSYGIQPDEFQQILAEVANDPRFQDTLSRNLGRPQRPNYEPVTDATPLAQELNAKQWYHGNATPGLSYDKLDVGRTQASSNLYGPGMYLTDDPSLSASYAHSRAGEPGGYMQTGTNVPKQYGVNVNLRNVIDLNKPPTPEILDLAKQLLAENGKASYISGAVEDRLARLPMGQLGQFGKGDMGLYKWLENILGGNQVINDFYARNGVDAWTHQGGLQGGKPHQVVIPLDPNGVRGGTNPGSITRFADVSRTRKYSEVPNPDPYDAVNVVPEAVNDIIRDIRANPEEFPDPQSILAHIDRNLGFYTTDPRVREIRNGALLRSGNYPGFHDEMIRGMQEGLKTFLDSVGPKRYGSYDEVLRGGIKRGLARTILDIQSGSDPWSALGNLSAYEVKDKLQAAGHVMYPNDFQKVKDIVKNLDRRFNDAYNAGTPSSEDLAGIVAETLNRISEPAARGKGTATTAINDHYQRGSSNQKWRLNRDPEMSQQMQDYLGVRKPAPGVPEGSTKGNAPTWSDENPTWTTRIGQTRPKTGQGLIHDMFTPLQPGPFTDWWREKLGFAPTVGVARDTSNSLLSKVGEKIFTQPSLTRFDMASAPAIGAKYLDRANGSASQLAHHIMNPEMADTAQEARVLGAMNQTFQQNYTKYVEKELAAGRTPKSIDSYATGWFQLPTNAKGNLNMKALTKEAKKSGLEGTDLQNLINDYIRDPDHYARDVMQRLSTSSMEDKLKLIRAEQKNVFQKAGAALMNGEANIKPGALAAGAGIVRDTVKSGLLAGSPRYYLQDTLDNAIRALFDRGLGAIRTTFLNPGIADRVEGVRGMIGQRDYIQRTFGTNINYGETFGDFATGTTAHPRGPLSTPKVAAERAAEQLDKHPTAIGKVASLPSAANSFLIGLSEPHERLLREAVWSRSFFPEVDRQYAALSQRLAAAHSGNPDVQAFVAGLRDGTTTSYAKARQFLQGVSSLTPAEKAQIARAVDSINQQAAAKAYVATQYSFNNYGLNVKFLDSASRALMPFSKYQTRFAPWIARTVAERPFLAQNSIQANNDLRSNPAPGARKSTQDKVFPGGGSWGFNPLDVVPWNRTYDMLFHPPSTGQRPTPDTDELGQMVPGLQENQGMNNSIPSRVLRSAIETGFAGTPYAPVQALGERLGVLTPALASTTDQPSIDLLSNVTDRSTPGFDVLGHHIPSVNLGELAGNILSPAGLLDRAVQGIAGTGSTGLQEYYIGKMMQSQPDYQQNLEEYRKEFRAKSGPLYEAAKRQALAYEQSSRNFSGTIPFRGSQLLPQEREQGAARALKGQDIQAAQQSLDVAGRNYNQAIYTKDPVAIAGAKQDYEDALSKLYASFREPGAPPSITGGTTNPTSVYRENPGFGEANADEYVVRQQSKGLSPEAVALQDEQRYAAKRYGSSAAFNPFYANDDSEHQTQQKYAQQQGNMEANDIITGRIFNPADRAKYLDYENAKKAYEGKMVDTPNGPQRVIDFLQSAGYFDMKNDDPNKAQIASIPAVKDYLTTLQVAGKRDDIRRLNLIRDNALMNPDTQQALAPLAKPNEYIQKNVPWLHGQPEEEARKMYGGQEFNPRPQTPGIQQDRLYFEQWNQNQRDAFDAYNDLMHSKDMQTLNGLFDKAPKKGEPGYKEFYQANGNEITRLENIKSAALSDIASRTGENPLHLVNQSHAIFGYQPVKEEIPAQRPLSNQNSSAYSPSQGSPRYSSPRAASSGSTRSNTRSSSSSTSQAAREAGNQFFDFYRGLSPSERARVRADGTVNRAVTGADKSLSSYQSALARAQELLRQPGQTRSGSTGSSHLTSIRGTRGVSLEDLFGNGRSGQSPGGGSRSGTTANNTYRGSGGATSGTQTNSTGTATDSFYQAYRDLPANLKGVARNDRTVQAVLAAKGKTDEATVQNALTIVNDIAKRKR